MATYNAGSASVRIRPDASGFIRDLRADLDRHRDPGFEVTVTADTSPAVRSIQRLSSDGSAVTVDVDADTTSASATMTQWRALQEANPLVVTVDVDTTSAMLALATLRASQQSAAVTVNVNADTTSASLQLQLWREMMQRDRLRIGVDADTGGAARALRALSGAGGRGINLGLAGLSQLPMAAMGVAQLAQALQQLAQVGLVVPGAMAGVVASVGTLAVGLSGVKDAYDAVAAAADSSGADQAAQARQAAAAHNQLRNAVVDEAQAQEDVARARKDARQQLADLNIELRGGQISEARALLELQRAQQDLVTGNFTDYADASLRVAETEQNLLEVRSRNAQLQQEANEANAQGVEGSDEVAAANERLIRTQQQVADAHAAVGDAAAASSATATAAAAAMENLSPAARDFVETILGVKPALESLRTSVQETMFSGLGNQLEGAFTSIMPTLEGGMTGVAQGWNDVFSELFTSIGDPENVGVLNSILTNTSESMAAMAGAVDPIVRGFGTLAAAGSDVLPRISDGIVTVSERFASFIEQADSDGRLAQWIDEGINGLVNLGNTAINIAKSFDAVTNAIDGNFLEALQVGTGKLAEFLSSVEGQNALREFFDHGESMLRAWEPILTALPGIFMSAMQGSGAAVQVLLELLSLPVALLREFPEVAGAAAAGLVAAFAASTVRSAIMGVVAMVATLRTSLVGTSGLTAALTVLSGPVGIGLVAAAAAATFLAFNNHVDSSIERTRQLEQAQKDLAETLDANTGRINAQTRTGLTEVAREWTSANQGGPSGDVIAAGQRLGVDPYQLISAGLGDTGAQSSINDLLVGSNLGPEFAANPELAKIQQILAGQGVSAETLYAALLGDQAAIDSVSAAITSSTGSSQFDLALQSGQVSGPVNDLGGITRLLSQTGLDSILLGNFIRQQSGLLPGAQSDVQIDNQAIYGPHALTPYGQNVFGAGAQVTQSGPDQFVVTTSTLSPEMAQTLRDRGHTVSEPTPPDTTWQINIAPERVQDIVAYAGGGPTPSGRGPGPTGGFLAELHDDEFVISKRGRAQVPDAFLHALNRGDVDLPGFQTGGPSEDQPHGTGGTGGVYLGPGGPNAPQPGGPTAPAPVAPNPTMGTSGGWLGAVNTAISGLQNPINTGLGILQGAANPATPTTPGGVTPAAGAGAGGFDPVRAWFPWLPQPGQDMGTWNPFANAPDKIQPQNIAAEFGSTLLNGVLSFFGLENSVLSPDNPYRQALTQTSDFYMNRFGAMGQTTGAGAGLTVPQIPGVFSTPGGINLPGGMGQAASALVPNPDNTDYIGAMSQIASQPQYGLTMTSGFREGDDGLHGTGMAGDFSNGAANTPEMLAFANYLADNYAPYISELIYDDPNFTRTIKNGQFVGPFGEFYTLDQAGPHNDHVHVAVTQAPALANDPVVQQFLGAQPMPPQPQQQQTNFAYNPEGGAAQWRPVVQQALAEVGPQFGITNYNAWTEDILGQIQFESGGNPAALNPTDSDGLPAIGLGQFKEGTFASHNIRGGDINDPVAQIYAMISYLASDRYGVVPDGGVNWGEYGWLNGRGYAGGGPTPSGRGPGPTGGFLAELHDDEFVISKRGRAQVPDAFLHALNRGDVDLPGFQTGGDPRLGVVPVPPPPLPPQIPDARPVVPRPAPQQPRPPSVPGPTPSAPTTPTVPAPAPAPAAPAAQTPDAPPVTAPDPTAPPPDSWDHNLGWIDTTIDSTASTLGNLGAMAAAAGISAAGSSGFAPGAGALAAPISSLIQGGAQQIGKVAKDAVNVVSSFLVGSVPGSMGEPGAPAYGAALRPDQYRPSTPDGQTFQRPGFGNTYQIQGYDPFAIRREIEAKESLDMQAALAHR